MGIEMYHPDLDIFEEGYIGETLVSDEPPATLSEEGRKSELRMLADDALNYIWAELHYLESVFDVDDVRKTLKHPDIPVSMISTFKGDGLVSSVDIHRYFEMMQRYSAYHNFVLGGPDGKFTTMSRHTYDPEIHRPLLRRGFDAEPSNAEDVLTGIPEIGVNRPEGYVRIVQPFFILPNRIRPGNEYSEMIKFVNKYAIDKGSIRVAPTASI